jgi:hypothetical protein
MFLPLSARQIMGPADFAHVAHEVAHAKISA